ncbi:MAG: nucleotidyl transferase AbiEii/AbiGii toxin family protein [Micrococcales bacterium]|nr:nucleotidyl transferase AbiEii/AbiGii toxin family protein [Micrococcales bacterium]
MTTNAALPRSLSAAETTHWGERFGVAEDQVRHDFLLSHVLTAIAASRANVVFYGGTALSRTFLPHLRLSEDIDLLSVGPRGDAAAALDESIRTHLTIAFGGVTADRWLSQARVDTDASVLFVAGTGVNVQLIDGRAYPPWPTALSTVTMRYAGMPDVRLTTLTGDGFVGAKTVAWCDRTRHAPRDLYDLWALGQAGRIDATAARTYRRVGPTGAYPHRWTLPSGPPSEGQWQDALAHQCLLRVTAAEAFDSVTSAWLRAVEVAENAGPA